jgi:hypothetical protein
VVANASPAKRQQAQQQQQQIDVPTFWTRNYFMQQQQPSAPSSSPTRLTAPAACAVAALGAALLALMPADAAHAAAHGADLPAHLAPAYDLSEGGQEFWGNVARYGRYFVTVMLGTGYVMVRPLLGLFRNPLTGVLAVVGIAGALYGVKITLDAMLGLSEFEYLPPSQVGF